jgi:hypothetical protein
MLLLHFLTGRRLTMFTSTLLCMLTNTPSFKRPAAPARAFAKHRWASALSEDPILLKSMLMQRRSGACLLTQAAGTCCVVLRVTNPQH